MLHMVQGHTVPYDITCHMLYDIWFRAILCYDITLVPCYVTYGSGPYCAMISHCVPCYVTYGSGPYCTMISHVTCYMTYGSGPYCAMISHCVHMLCDIWFRAILCYDITLFTCYVTYGSGPYCAMISHLLTCYVTYAVSNISKKINWLIFFLTGPVQSKVFVHKMSALN